MVRLKYRFIKLPLSSTHPTHPLITAPDSIYSQKMFFFGLFIVAEGSVYLIMKFRLNGVVKWL